MKTRPKINLCACGCGEMVAGMYKLGHNMKVKENAEAHSQTLQQQERKGSKHHSWKGGVTARSSGRTSVRVDGTYHYRARVIMEQHLGRKLAEEEIVHHINGDVADDRIENLQLHTRGSHTTLHRIGKLHTEESKVKISVNRKGKGTGESNCMYGKHHSPETIRKISEVRRRQEQVKKAGGRGGK